ncbi:protease complex subunit PrcB family protein [Candidatus Bathyarchaeota archaeon]|nr:MAG: protease complex subunit PrcB family protein [Candidatus Bathyarchaeota archaeon]
MLAVIILAVAIFGVFLAYGMESSYHEKTVSALLSPKTGDDSPPGSKTAELDHEISKKDVAIHTIPGGWGGNGQPAYFVINDQSTLSTVWTEEFCTSHRIFDPTNPTACVPPVPEVNFTERTVLAVFLGEKPTGGYSIQITDVDSRASHLVVTVLTTVPGPYCIVTQAFTSPYQMIWIPKTDQKVLFVSETNVINCSY